MNHFLDDSIFKEPSYTIQYVVNSNSKPKSQKVPIYDDDTIKEVLIKLSVASNYNITSDHIFAWINKNGTIIPISFTYPDLDRDASWDMDQPFKNKKIDPLFIDSSGQRIAVKSESTMHKIMDYFDHTTIFYTTLFDYLTSLKF